MGKKNKTSQSIAADLRCNGKDIMSRNHAECFICRYSYISFDYTG